jgi:hypothetical protein
MKQGLIVLGITTFFVFTGFVCWDVFSLGLSLHDSVLAPIVQIPWAVLALIGMAIAHKGRTAFLIGCIAVFVCLYRVARKRQKISN